MRPASVSGVVGLLPRPTCAVVFGASRRTARTETGNDECAFATVAERAAGNTATAPVTSSLDPTEGITAELPDASKTARPEDDEEALPQAGNEGNEDDAAVDATVRRGTLFIGTTTLSQLGVLGFLFGAMKDAGQRPLRATAKDVTLVYLSSVPTLELNG